MTTSWTSPPSSSADPLPPEGTLAWRPGPPQPGDPEPPWPPVLVAEDLLEAGIVAAFTGRAGGTSSAPFATLNLALRVEDDLRRVLANRRRVATVLGLAGHPWAMARQVHGATILHLRADPPGDGPPKAGSRLGEGIRLGQGPPEGKAPVGEADGLVTADPGVVLAVLTADCAPVLLADPGAGVVGAVHAGWRGLAAGVVEAGMAAMAELGADPGAVVGLVGPAVGGCCYEVGPEVREAVGGRYPAALATTRNGLPGLDPAAGAGQALERAGVGQLRVAGECTVDLEERFFSHRRDHGRTGRQAGLIALVPGGGR